MDILRSRSGRLPILIIVVLAVLVVGGLAAMKFMKHGKRGKPVPKPVEYSLWKMNEFTVNLADTGTPHYIKVTMMLEVEGKAEAEGKEGGAEASPDSVKATDAIIAVLTRKCFNELLAESGKEQLKKDIIKAVSEVEEKKKIHNVYFTSFAMQ